MNLIDQFMREFLRWSIGAAAVIAMAIICLLALAFIIIQVKGWRKND